MHFTIPIKTPSSRQFLFFSQSSSLFCAGIFKQSMLARIRVGYRTGPPGYMGWRNLFLGIDFWAPSEFKNSGSGWLWHCTGPSGYIGWRNWFLGIDFWAPSEFKNSGSGWLWHCTGPPGYIDWRNWFLGIDSWAPWVFKNNGSGWLWHCCRCLQTCSTRWSRSTMGSLPTPRTLATWTPAKLSAPSIPQLLSIPPGSGLCNKHMCKINTLRVQKCEQIMKTGMDAMS